MQKTQKKEIFIDTKTVEEKCNNQVFDISDYHADNKLRKFEHELAP